MEKFQKFVIYALDKDGKIFYFNNLCFKSQIRGEYYMIKHYYGKKFAAMSINGKIYTL